MNGDDDKNQGFLRGVADLYTRSLSEHGVAPMAVGWKDDVQQRLRFDKLIQVIGQNADRGQISVNDLGCGYGAMFGYLDEKLGQQLAHYYGYDISSKMLIAAQQQITDPRAEFSLGSEVTGEADYSFASGIFNVKLDTSDETWTEYVKEVVLNLSMTSRYGFAFNVLTTYVDWKQDHLYYADPLLFFDFCKRNISNYVSLVHDYPLYEWTMLVYNHQNHHDLA